MPRVGGQYFLPSPPMPLVPGSLATAEDMNLILQDIAGGITESLAVDGSTPITGPLNLNGQNITGAGTVSANNLTGSVVTAGNYVNSPNYVGGSMNLGSFIQSSGGRIISEGVNNNASVTVWNPAANYAAGMFVGAPTGLYFGGMDGQGNYVGPVYGQFNPNGDFVVPTTIYCGNIVANVGTVGGVAMAGGNLVTPGSVQCNYLQMGGDVNLNGHALGGVGRIDMTSGGINMMNHDIAGCGTLYVQAVRLNNMDGTGNIHIYNPIDMSNTSIYNAWDIHANGAFYGYVISDSRLKQNIRPLDAGLAELMRLRPVRFTLEGRSDAGLLADEVAEVMPYVVREAQRPDSDEEPVKTMSLTAVPALCVAAIQELARELAALRAKVNGHDT